MTLRTWAAYALTIGLTLAGVAPLAAVSTSKFAAWTWSGWTDSLIPLHFAIRDPRQDRQNTTPGETPAVVATFATTYKGHLYVVDDEPDLGCVAPATYAARYRGIVTAVLAVDPTARFSPGGFAGSGSCPPGSLYGTAYAAAFRTAYTSAYGALPVAEWRFHYFLDPANINAFKTWANTTASWAVTNGAPLYIGSTGFHWVDPLLDVRPQLREVLDFINADSRIVGAAFWNYDIYIDGNGTPQYHTMAQTGSATNPRALSIDGIELAAYTTALVSGQRSGLVELGDFDGDNRADFADHQISARRFWVHQNLGNGSFDAGNWAIGDLLPGQVPTVPSDWDVLVADFTGDGLADYADVHVPTGQIWVHRNLGGSFDTGAWSWGQGRAGADWELLVGNFDSDPKADLIEHQLSTGLLWVKINNGTSGFASPGGSVGRTAVGPGWKTVIADFTGDGRVDYADLHVPSNKFWVHPAVPLVAANPTGPHVFNAGHIAEASITASAGWETLFGDFTGDGLADYADRALGSGTFYIHQNLNNGTFSTLDWGVGQSVAGADWNVLGSR